MKLVKKMYEMADTLSVYDQKSQSIRSDWERAKNEAESAHEETLQSIANAREESIQAAKARKIAWDNKLESSRKYMDRLQKTLRERVYYAANGHTPTGLINDPMGDSIRQLREMSPGREYTLFRPGDNDELVAVASSAEDVMASFTADCAAAATAAQEQYNEEMSYAQRSYASQNAQEEVRHSQMLQDAQNTYQQQQAALHQDLVTAFNTTIDPQGIRDEYDARMGAIPTHANYTPPKEFPEQICFGYAGYEITEDLADATKKQALTASCGYMMVQEGKRSYLKFPYGFGFTDPRFSTLFEFDNATRSQMIEHMQSLVLRLMMSPPCNKAWLTLIDPIELGKTFGMFAPWGDVEARVIDTRIWHDEARIEERLQTIIDHTSDVNFRCLQGRYENIIEYNKSAGKNAEPLRFLVIMDFPRHFTPAALDKLESIVTNGPTTGVFALIAGDTAAMNESLDPAVQRIRDKMNVVSLYKGCFFTSDKVKQRALRFMPMPCASDSAAIETVKKIGEGIHQAESIVIKLEDVYGSEMRLMSYDASNGISVPIGLEGANKRVELKLGGVSEGGRARSYHAMIGGNIGSGKSSMLHNIILGILMRYSPAEVQMYLVDMKEGVEFKRYAHHMGLKNLRVIAVDAEKEFGLAVLQELANEQWLRGQRFKETGTSRIEAYNQKMRDENRLDDIMPRLVVIIDEIQWMFDKADDPITQECAHLLESLILMGGSAFGIQIILATQDWANVVGLKESIYNNIGVRIALKNNQASAQTILATDNEIINRLTTYDSGQAVFNEYAGHKDFNHEFRGILITQNEAHQMLTELERLQAQIDLGGNPAVHRLLSSDIQDHESSELNQFAKAAVIPGSNEMRYRLFLGESLGMMNTFFPALSAQRGKNLLLVGSDERTASTLSAFAMMSLLLESLRLEKSLPTAPVITLFDFSSPSQSMYANTPPMLQMLLQELPQVFRVFRSTDVLNGLQILESDLNASADAPQHFVFFFGLNRARRLIDGGAYDQRPRDLLVKLLHKGPEMGMNFIVWANSPSAFQQYYGDALNEFELRLLFDKVEDDLYPFYVQDKKPDSMDERNALSFNLDGDNQMIKMYSSPSPNWVGQFAAALRKHIQ